MSILVKIEVLSDRIIADHFPDGFFFLRRRTKYQISFCGSAPVGNCLDQDVFAQNSPQRVDNLICLHVRPELLTWKRKRRHRDFDGSL